MDRFTTKNSDTTHRVIGYAIGVLGLVVSGVVIYGVGGPLFPDKHLSKEDQRRGNYENFVPMIAKFHVLVFLCWLFAVYKDKRIVILISFVFWLGNFLLVILCAYFYFYEGIPRQFKEREIFLLAGIGYWIGSLFVAGIWYTTRNLTTECPRIAESELLQIK